MDNGAFAAFRHGEAFPAARFWRRLNGAVDQGVLPLWAVAPDEVAGGRRSFSMSAEWAYRLPADVPLYLAVQDGMVPEDLEEKVEDLFAGIFFGGSDRFKLDARLWCDWAHSLGLPFHYARAGTLRKLRQAIAIGADSLDSTFPLWTADRLEAFADTWLKGLAPRLPFGVHSREGLS